MKDVSMMAAKLKLSLCLTKYHAMETNEGVEE
jgi:hypothetical protein